LVRSDWRLSALLGPTVSIALSGRAISETLH
jgi:hypothetical protein